MPLSEPKFSQDLLLPNYAVLPYLPMDRDSNIYEDFSPWRARTPIKPTKPKTSIPQKPAERPAQPDPRMPLLKERARLLSELKSATGLFIIFKLKLPMCDSGENVIQISGLNVKMMRN